MTTLEFNKEYLTLINSLIEEADKIKIILDKVYKLKEKTYSEIYEAYQRKIEAEDEAKFTDEEYIERYNLLDEWENYSDDCSALAFDLSDIIKTLLNFRE